MLVLGHVAGGAFCLVGWSAVWVTVQDLVRELLDELTGGVGREREVHAGEAIRLELVESLNDLVGLAREAEVPDDLWGDESCFVGFEVGVVTWMQLLMRSILVSPRVKHEVVVPAAAAAS